MHYRNPILPGYHPDPSICRVGDDFYLVNSTFEFFPGVPVYHSRNLVNWERIGYCLTRKEQDVLDGCRASGGIYAPTIRYHEGTFFMTTTNVSSGGNFIVHTRDPRGEWSEPAWVAQGGIDPTVFFDDDGKVYFMSTGEDEEGSGIFLCEMDPFTGKMLTESRCISHGCGGRNPEGPHIYKKNGRYYLMLAEGGTEYGHMETIQKSDCIYGPYEPCPHNPILTHRDDTAGEIGCTGHADLVEDAAGNWWMVCLGIRPTGKRPNMLMLHHLGRETFLAPVDWSGDWPVVGDHGKIALDMEGPLPGEAPETPSFDFEDPFERKERNPEYNFIRNPEEKNYRVDPSLGLILAGTDRTLNDVSNPTWLGIRQQAFEVLAKTRVRILPDSPDGICGITAFYNNGYHYDLCLEKRGSERRVFLRKHVHDMETVSEKIPLAGGGDAELEIEAFRDHYEFYLGEPGGTRTLVGTGLAAGLCTEQTCTMTFTGTYLGLFAEKAAGVFRMFSIRGNKSCEI